MAAGTWSSECVGQFSRGTCMSDTIEFIEEVAGIYFRSIIMDRGESSVQHTHTHDHATYCGSGSASIYVDGELEGEVRAGHAVAVIAGKKHRFIALEDETRLTCVHDAASAMSIKEKGL